MEEKVSDALDRLGQSIPSGKVVNALDRLRQSTPSGKLLQTADTAGIAAAVAVARAGGSSDEGFCTEANKQGNKQAMKKKKMTKTTKKQAKKRRKKAGRIMDSWKPPQVSLLSAASAGCHSGADGTRVVGR
jgi:hypothetical protein